MVALTVLGVIAVGAGWLTRSPAWGLPEGSKLAAPMNDEAAIRAALDALTLRVRDHAAPEVVKAVAKVRTTLLTLAEKIDELPAGSEDAFILKRTATNYLPSTLDTYLALPSDFAEHQGVDGTATPKDVLLKELALMSAKLADIGEAINKGDADRFMANARFLTDRFGTADDLELPEK